MSFDRHRPYKWILLPIETKIREFHAKVLLSCAAAEAGFGVVLWTLGDSKRQKWLTLPRGISLEKSIVKANEKKFALLRKHGNKVCAWCEEGLVLLSRQEYQQRRICPESVGQVEDFALRSFDQQQIAKFEHYVIDPFDHILVGPDDLFDAAA